MSNSSIKVKYKYNDNPPTSDLGIYPSFPVGWTLIQSNNSGFEDIYMGPKEFQYEMKSVLTKKFNELVSDKIIKSYLITKFN
jgi:hypothetical protein